MSKDTKKESKERRNELPGELERTVLSEGKGAVVLVNKKDVYQVYFVAGKDKTSLVENPGDYDNAEIEEAYEFIRNAKYPLAEFWIQHENLAGKIDMTQVDGRDDGGNFDRGDDPDETDYGMFVPDEPPEGWIVDDEDED